MKPIPKSLLIHDVQIQTVSGKDAWGAEEFSAPVPVHYVRLEPSTKYVKNKQNEEIQLAAVLFYDCHNSRPRGLTFHDGQAVAFHGEMYRIQLVEPLYDGRKLHHFEVGLIRNA